MKVLSVRWRNRWISIFVVVWLCVFHYETFRLWYISPVLERQLPKLPLLFPPAGWIMFYQINPVYGYAEVYGVKNQTPEVLDPHTIFETDAIGYDNIHRNVLIGVLHKERSNHFCDYLRNKFPEYTSFVVAYAEYSDLVNQPGKVQKKVLYRCN